MGNSLVQLEPSIQTKRLRLLQKLDLERPTSHYHDPDILGEARHRFEQHEEPFLEHKTSYIPDNSPLRFAAARRRSIDAQLWQDGDRVLVSAPLEQRFRLRVPRHRSASPSEHPAPDEAERKEQPTVGVLPCEERERDSEQDAKEGQLERCHAPGLFFQVDEVRL